MTAAYVLPGALFALGDLVSYDQVNYVVMARRRTAIGIVYHLLSEGVERLAHHNVPQGLLRLVKQAKAEKS